MNHLQYVIRNLRTLRLLKLGHAEKYHLHILSQCLSLVGAHLCVVYIWLWTEGLTK